MRRILKLLALITFLVIALFIVVLGGIFPVNDEGGQKLEVFSDDKGSPALSVGNCNSDSECKPTGCSSQVCANHEIITTCELGVFPESETYSCGCKNNKCVWYRYK